MRRSRRIATLPPGKRSRHGNTLSDDPQPTTCDHGTSAVDTPADPDMAMCADEAVAEAEGPASDNEHDNGDDGNSCAEDSQWARPGQGDQADPASMEPAVSDPRTEATDEAAQGIPDDPVDPSEDVAAGANGSVDAGQAAAPVDPVAVAPADGTNGYVRMIARNQLAAGANVWEGVSPCDLPTTCDEDDDGDEGDDGEHCRFCATSDSLRQGGYDGLYHRDACLTSQYALYAQAIEDFPTTVQVEETGIFATPHNEKRKQACKAYVRRLGIYRGQGNRMRIPKCFNRLVRNVWPSPSYMGHKDAVESDV